MSACIDLDTINKLSHIRANGFQYKASPCPEGEYTDLQRATYAKRRAKLVDALEPILTSTTLPYKYKLIYLRVYTKSFTFAKLYLSAI